MPTKIDFIGGNTKRCLMAMALPMIAAMFLNIMYNLVDSLWIGNLLGETAYAALTNSTPIILILTSVAMGATNGVSILISQAIGAKDKKKTESLISTSFCVAVVFSLLVTILLEAFLPGILKVLNTPAETYDMAYSYLAIYVLGYLAVYLYLYFTAVLRSFGNSMFQAVAMLVSTILNAILDPIFIHFIGFHGAAIATLLSQLICLLFMLIYLKKEKLFGYVLNTVTNCYLGTLNGMGKPSKSMFLMIFYYIVVRIPLAYLLSYLGFGLNGIWTAVLVSHVVASIAAAITGTIFVKKKESAEK